MAGRKKVLFTERQHAQTVADSRGESVIELDFNAYSTDNAKAGYFVGTIEAYESFKARRKLGQAKKPSLANWAKRKEREVWYSKFFADNTVFTAQDFTDFLCEKMGRCNTYSYGLATRQIKVWIEAGKLENYFEGKTSLYRKIL